MNVGGVGTAPGGRDVVDEVAVLGAVGGEGAGGAEGGIEVVVVAGVVDDPEVGDDVGMNAASAIAVDDVVDDEDGWGIGGRGVIGAVRKIEDDAVAVGVVGGGAEFAADDVVGDDVVEAGVVIEPLTSASAAVAPV